MIDPVFLKSSIHYDGYDDFWELVRLSDYHVLPTLKADLSQPGTYICPMFDCEFMTVCQNHPPGRRQGTVVFWYLERPDAHLSHGLEPVSLFQEAMGEFLQMADQVWVSDTGLYRLDPRSRFAVLGGHPGLRRCPPMEPVYDVAHFGQIPERRKNVLDRLLAKGFRITPSSWGPRRERALAESKLMLGIDRFSEIHVGTPLRWVLAAAYDLPIIHEKLPDPYPLVDQESILMYSYQDLAEGVEKSLARPDLAAFGSAAWRVYCDRWTFRNGIDSALRGIPALPR